MNPSSLSVSLGFALGLAACSDGATTSNDSGDANGTGDVAEVATCEGTWEDACREGRIVQLCCPTGIACNYGMGLVDCGDGTCVEAQTGGCPE